MNRLVHFEIHADDVDRAKKFYAEVFGWEYTDYSHFTGEVYWGIRTGNPDEMGIDGGLLQRPTSKAVDSQSGANAFVCIMGVADFDSVDAKIRAAGGVMVQPKAPLPGMAWQGYYLDTEGNTFGIHQPDENAK